MKRRDLIRTMTLGIGGLMSLPAWANAWTPTSLQLPIGLLADNQQETLAEIVATIIPEGDIPVAKSLGVPAFVQKMIKDCYEANVQENFKKGLDTTNNLAQTNFGKSFVACDATQRMDILKKLETSSDADQKSFFSLVKNLTIQGYTTTEYVMVNHLNYVMAPGHYYGCVPVKS